jgi:tetratricopeptide (TPR) repeat protein
MSLLLDALKEAENRHRRAPLATPLAPASVEMPDHVLALADDIAPLTQPALPLRATADDTATVSVLATLRAARKPDAPARTAAAPAAAAPARDRPPVLLLLIAGLAVLVLALGGAYLYLTASTSIVPSQPPPSLPPAASTLVVSDAARREGLIVTEADEPARHSDVAPSVLPPTNGIPAARPQPAAEASHTPPRDVSPSRAARTPTAAPPVAANRLVIENRPSPLLQAHVALRAGDLVQAERLYRETLATQPDQPDAHLGLALIEQSRGATSAAVAHYRAVLNVVPAQPQAWAGLSDLAGDAELDTMESQLRGLIAARPEGSLHFALGNLFARQSRWADAQQSFFAASTAAPQNAEYAFNLAVALDRMGKGKVAMTHYARALALAGDARAVQFDTAAARTRLAELQGSTP